MLFDDGRLIKNNAPMQVQDISLSTENLAVTGETISFADGAAGTTQQIKLANDSIMDSKGRSIAVLGDTSLAFTTGTVLTNEVAWKYTGHATKDNDTARLATMDDGDFMVDNLNGYILGKNAITTSTATDTLAYTVRKQAIVVSSSGSSGGVEVSGDVAHDAVDSGNPVKIGGKAQDPTSLPTAVTVGNRVNASFSEEGEMFVYNTRTIDEDNDAISIQPIEPSNANTTVFAASLVLKSSAGLVYEIRGYNSGSAQFIQIHDATSLPADGAVPEDILAVEANENFYIEYKQGKRCTSGIVVCNSSTEETKTIGSGDCWISGEYR